MKRILRSAAVFTTAVVTITTISATATATATAAVAAPDPKPVTVGATWMAGELEEGLLRYPDTGFGAYDDFGLSIDVALALAAVDQRPVQQQEVGAAVASGLESYITGEAFGDPDSTYAGATAKAAVLAATVGADPTSFGGINLVTRLEGLVSSTAPIAGRIEDVSSFGDFANSIGQAFASQALHTAGSAEAGAVTDFLLQQQCSAGYFRVAFTEEKTSPDQSCDAAGGSADTDATALVVLALQDQATTPAVGAALDEATTWLAAQQAADGSFTSGDPLTPDKNTNTNSTGLAGWALGASGATEEATAAAVWVRRNQAADTSPCTTELTSERGALAYNRPAAAAGRADGITVGTTDQWRRATAQALPVLQWAPAADDDSAITGPTRFVRAKSTQTLRVSGLAPSERGCVYGGGDQQVLRGTGARLDAEVTMPAGTADRVFGVSSLDGTERTTLRVLGTLEVPFGFADRRLAKGATQTVRVSGLEAGEAVTIRWRGEVVATGVAGPAGRFSDSFKVGRTSGPGKVRVTGRFADLRTNTKSFTVR